MTARAAFSRWWDVAIVAACLAWLAVWVTLDIAQKRADPLADPPALRLDTFP